MAKSYKFLILVFAVVFLVLAGIFTFSFNEVDAPRSDLPREAIVANYTDPIARAEFQKLDLAALGRMPRLSFAMKRNDDLRARVEKLCAYDALFVFGNVGQIDREVVELLLIWSGVDLSVPVTQKTADGLHPHVDHFLRQIYALDKGDSLSPYILLGDDPWIGYSQRFKAQILAQCNAGKDVFDGEIYYDPEIGRLLVDGQVSSDFVTTFKAMISDKDDPKLYTNNFLAFLNRVKPLSTLSDKEKALLEF